MPLTLSLSPFGGGGVFLYLFYYRADELALFYFAHGPAFNKEKPAAFARGNAEVGFLHLTRAINNAAHYRDAQARELALFVFNFPKRLLDFIRNTYYINLCPAACRAGEDFRAERAQAETLYYMFPNDDLVDRVAGERYPYGISYPLGEQYPYAQRGLYSAREFGPRGRDAEMERVVAFIGQDTVGVYRLRDVGTFKRDHNVAEVEALYYLDIIERGFNHQRGKLFFRYAAFGHAHRT